MRVRQASLLKFDDKSVRDSLAEDAAVSDVAEQLVKLQLEDSSLET